MALFPWLLARIFTPNQELIDLVSRVMPIFFGGIWAFGAQMACPVRLYGHGAVPHQPVSGPAAQGDSAGSSGPDSPRITGSVMGIYAAEPIADFVASATP